MTTHHTRKRFPLLLFGYVALALGLGAMLMELPVVAIPFFAAGGILCGANLIRQYWGSN
jgi:hypothetical protein